MGTVEGVAGSEGPQQQQQEEEEEMLVVLETQFSRRQALGLFTDIGVDLEVLRRVHVHPRPGESRAARRRRKWRCVCVFPQALYRVLQPQTPTAAGARVALTDTRDTAALPAALRERQMDALIFVTAGRTQGRLAAAERDLLKHCLSLLRGRGLAAVLSPSRVQARVRRWVAAVTHGPKPPGKGKPIGPGNMLDLDEAVAAQESGAEERDMVEEEEAWREIRLEDMVNVVKRGRIVCKELHRSPHPPLPEELVADANGAAPPPAPPMSTEEDKEEQDGVVDANGSGVNEDAGGGGRGGAVSGDTRSVACGRGGNAAVKLRVRPQSKPTPYDEGEDRSQGQPGGAPVHESRPAAAAFSKRMEAPAGGGAEDAEVDEAAAKDEDPNAIVGKAGRAQFGSFAMRVHGSMVRCLLDFFFLRAEMARGNVIEEDDLESCIYPASSDYTCYVEALREDATTHAANSMEAVLGIVSSPLVARATDADADADADVGEKGVEGDVVQDEDDNTSEDSAEWTSAASHATYRRACHTHSAMQQAREERSGADGNDAATVVELVRAPCFYEWTTTYPQLQLLVDHLEEIKEEVRSVAHWMPWPEDHYNEGGRKDWSVFPFCHTFPAYSPRHMQWVDITCERCPRTAALLRQLPGLRTALFSKLGSSTTISAHMGWADLANYVLRCHLCLDIPAGDKCGVWVEGEEMKHVQDGFVIFDDSKLHKAYNRTLQDRYVLIVDLERPSQIPLGTAVGGHTEQLDEFINAYATVR